MSGGNTRGRRVSEERQEKAKEMLNRMIEKGIFAEEHEAQWLERQKKNGVKAIDILEAFMQGGVRPLEHGAEAQKKEAE